jgi:hypothetical protein
VMEKKLLSPPGIEHLFPSQSVIISVMVYFMKPRRKGGYFNTVVFNLGYTYPRRYAKTSHTNQKETQEPLEP